jgi:hypothetical protein
MEAQERLRIFEEIGNMLTEKGFKYLHKNNNTTFMATHAGGLKAEYNYGSGKLAIKLIAKPKNDHESTIEQMTDWVIENYGEDSLVDRRKKPGSNVINFLEDVTPDQFVEVVELLDQSEFDLEFPYSDGSKSEVLVGPTFVNTVFENIKERGATMSGKFGSLVCEASGMDLNETLAEFYTNAGEIDGVELNENEEVISIYECQSGIHKGAYLDETHLNKSLGKYLYDPKILPTVKKVVILAGGYYEDHLNFIRERSKELARRDNPIEVVLLKTVKVDNKIKIEQVEL